MTHTAPPRLPGYELVARLGEGGAGVVWAARRNDGLDVAIKLLRTPGRGHDARRLEREGRALLRVAHPALVRVLEVAHDDQGSPCLVLERLHGRTLRDRLDSPPRPSLAETGAHLAPVADALVHLHAQSLVHRDLKPSNVFLAEAPAPPGPRLLDLGLVKLLHLAGATVDGSLLTASGELLGTPCYMAPEQLAGERDIGPLADVWAFGAMLYEALAGVRPVQASNLGAVMRIVLGRGVTPLSELELDVPPGLCAVVDRMLVVARPHRLSSLIPARDMLASLASGAFAPR